MKIKSLRINGRSVLRLSINGKAVSLGKAPAVCDALCFTAQEPGSTVKLTKNGSAPAVNLQTSTDGVSWTPYTVEDTITLANADDKVYFKAVGSNNSMGSSSTKYNKFVMSGKIAASGNVNSLLEEDEQTARTMSLAGKDNCYAYMFSNCSSLTQAPELPATTLAIACYNNMFRHCSSLTQAPVLPSTTLADSCYLYMFYHCTSLTSAPSLPADTLVNNCYKYMFDGCTSLTRTPALPATTLALGCYENMFSNCTSLTQAPELPVTTLASRCYQAMFQSCSSLTQAPALPATTLAGDCYKFMFDGCSSLTTAPELPATTLARFCYEWMFSKCTSLTSAPALPATTLDTQCYGNMFRYSSSLTTAPELPATTLANNCYFHMFDGCTNLNYVKVGFTNWDPTNATDTWLPDNVGTFECHQALIDNTTDRTSSTVPSNWSMVAYDAEPGPEPEPVQCDALCFTAQEPGSTVKLTKVSNAPAVNLQTSTDGVTWTPYTVEDTITLANVDDKVYFKAVGSNKSMGSSSITYNKFVMSGKIAASGNVNSLLEEDEQTARTMSLTGKQFCYYLMFYNCESLTQAPEFPAIELAANCYENMFYNCKSLIQAPELPATTLADSCYGYMFANCTSLTTAPEKLPATELTRVCYESMFYNCKSLIQAPVLPATTLATSCYKSMFSGCSSLTQAPELPATTLLFDYCYESMFYNCTNLNYIKVGFTNWNPTNATSSWLPNNSGTFECPQALIDNTTDRTASTVPANWSMVAA